MEIYTIGFAGTTAPRFFLALRNAGIKLLIDVRLGKTSQLSGFARAQDLPFFLSELCSAEYRHEPLLCPTKELLSSYRKRSITWDSYAAQFLDLLRERKVEVNLDKALFNTPTVLLCSEAKADRCHRRLVVEYLETQWGGLEVSHL